MDNLFSGFFGRLNPELQDELCAGMHRLQVDGRIRAASLCTGWGVADMVLDSLNDTLARSSKNAPKARGSSDRVGFALSQVVSFVRG